MGPGSRVTGCCDSALVGANNNAAVARALVDNILRRLQIGHEVTSPPPLEEKLQLLELDEVCRNVFLSTIHYPLFTDRRVPVYHLHVVSSLGQPLLDLFGNQHRAMFSSGASERDGQIALAFMNVVRNQIDQQLRDAVDELLGLRK